MTDSFNSCMVQLKSLYLYAQRLKKACFNSCMVQLKSWGVIGYNQLMRF